LVEQNQDASLPLCVWGNRYRQDVENRTNLALVSTVEVDAGDDTFIIELYDGETGTKLKTLKGITLKAGR